MVKVGEKFVDGHPGETKGPTVCAADHFDRA